MSTLSRPEEGKAAGDRLELKLFGEIHAFRYCPPGTFLMSSPEDEEGNFADEDQDVVVLSRGYWLGETPVTQRQWTAVAGENPSDFRGDDLPVENVSWYNCQDYLARLGDEAPDGYYFTFPTEAQWENACRADTTTPFNFGSRCSGLECNCDGTNLYGYKNTRKHIESQWLERTTPVRSYPPNPWGFYDMHGNVQEWCADWDKTPLGSFLDFNEANLSYADDEVGFVEEEAVVIIPEGAPRIDPVGPTTGVRRVVRGGCWYAFPEQCRSAFRFSYRPIHSANDVGFRVCMTPEVAR